LGGMGGAQPLAATFAGACSLNIECQQSSIDFRLRTRYVDKQARDIDDALALIAHHTARKEAVSITLLGFKVPTELLFLLVGLAGATTIGTQILTYAYVGQFYPMAVRSTGIGWASGVGRSGAILAPIVIGTLVGMALPLEQNFMAIAIPAVIATVAVSLIDHKRSASAIAVTKQGQAKVAAQS